MLTAASQPHFDPPHRMVLMGVAGCGKSSVGAALAPILAAEYLDGDDLHPPGNIAKMRRGEALTDDDRTPWLALVGAALRLNNHANHHANNHANHHSGQRCIIGCSALKRLYRSQIIAAALAPVTFIHLAGNRSVIEARMRARTGHFMPPSLLDSQFAALEPPGPDERAITVDIDQSFDSVIAAILAQLAKAET